MHFLCRLTLLLLLIFHSFLLTTDGLGLGGGCGCPCMPQPCLPQLPPIALPSLCLPQIPLPCPPPKCGCCCGRKKRGAVESKVGSTGALNDGQKHCNDPHIRRIILKNLVVGDPVGSKAAIHSELRAKLGGHYVVLCSQAPALSFAADSITHFCLEGHNALGCAVFKFVAPLFLLLAFAIAIDVEWPAHSAGVPLLLKSSVCAVNVAEKAQDEFASVAKSEITRGVVVSATVGAGGREGEVPKETNQRKRWSAKRESWKSGEKMECQKRKVEMGGKCQKRQIRGKDGVPKEEGGNGRKVPKETNQRKRWSAKRERWKWEESAKRDKSEEKMECQKRKVEMGGKCQKRQSEEKMECQKETRGKPKGEE
ncbi:hypothetical protein niasHT_000264 [Heterodera trifolii]|uniref:Ground-like domain-containing protein n=1 Tax=Heterodera trifolii TaxID=157864 RepID=A0ABD2LTI5_9BILA